jgi:hypothetical protein
VAICRYRCVFSFYFFLEKKFFDGQEFAGHYERCLGRIQ